ncbi:NAD(P)H-dependent oxidoreductase [Sphingobacterium spiritivorum]|uniref:NAD(P)H-dependent oxidoreductase n=1 Tax=Sphingobacterium spiritivorum TaxID=258 RepID=UPI003DA5F00F
MTKTLIIVIHPDLSSSRINKRWMEELKKYPEHYTVHDLYGTYPDEQIDIAREQALLSGYDRIIFQFCFYWFNCPPLFKKWLDVVLTHGWAYGRDSGYRLAGKKIALAITAGIDEPDFSADGRYKYSLQQLTTPFEITFQYIHADYRPLFAFYGAEHHATTERLEQSVLDYIEFIDQLT